jgi:nanoRNase/pAp phosphatase (c-di-AMP/oligoRNAs hydrolase)
VRAAAEQFGGGGHRQAAGVTLSTDREAAQRAILDVVCAIMA